MNTKQLIICALVLLGISTLIWIESGRAYNNVVLPAGGFKVVVEIKDFVLDFQLSSAADPLSLGWHGYSKNSWSEASPFGDFEVVRVFGTPDGNIPFYSQVRVPAWLGIAPPILLLCFLAFRIWTRRDERPEQVGDGKPDPVSS